VSKDIRDLNSEPQEVMDSGLRILAQMIATAHRRRFASARMKEGAVTESEKPRYLGHMLKSPGKYFNDMQSEDSIE
jgi:hypothetical protein